MEPADPALESEVERKIGRNLILLQKIELLLKVLLVNADRVVSQSPVLRKAEEERNESIRTSTLGALKTQFVGTVFGADPPRNGKDPLAVEVDAPVARFRYTFESVPERHKKLVSDLERLVKERNQLMHHFVEKLFPKTQAHYALAVGWLDDQHARAAKIWADLVAQAKSADEAASKMAAHMVTREYAVMFERAWLIQSPVVEHLVQLSVAEKPTGGWLPLASAGNSLHKHLANDMASLFPVYGHKTLKSLVKAVGCFSTREVELPGGHSVLEFRSEWDGESEFTFSVELPDEIGPKSTSDGHE